MSNVNIKKIVEMAVMQHKLNSRIDPNWTESGNDYLLAAMQEASEANDHHGWKWWKHQDKAVGQLKMELIDIWHFLLSECILRNIPLDSETYFDVSGEDNSNFIKLSKKFISMCGDDVLPLHMFFRMMDSVGMSFEELYKVYVAKNVLNIFRQDNGYKEGTYIKVWNSAGKIEDNEFVTMLLDKMDWEADGFPSKLTEKLTAQYQKELSFNATRTS